MTPIRGLALSVMVLSAAVLLTALATETFGGLVPCALCLVERWPYRVAIGLAIAAVVLPRMAARWVLWAVVLCMAAGLATATVHVGVENGWWPSPLPECAAPRFGSGSIAERLARMPASVAKPCDDPVYLIPVLPVSMAELNLLASLAIGAGLAVCLRRENRRAL